MGTVSFSFVDTARAAEYPPVFQDGTSNPEAPALDSLKFEVTFDELDSDHIETRMFSRRTLRSTMPSGTYTVTMEVFLADDTPYAYGSATNNPVTINRGNNPAIQIKLFDAQKTPTVWVCKGGGADEPYPDLKQALDFITGGSSVVKLGADQDLEPYTFTGPTARDITLISTDASTKTVQLSSNGFLFEIFNGTTLTLDNGITLRGRNNSTHGADNDNSLIAVVDGGTLIMRGNSVITGNSNPATGFTGTGMGGGVHIHRGSLIMHGGTISNNTASHFGGGVYMLEGSLTMYGSVQYVFPDGSVRAFGSGAGIITGNSADVGGGVHMDGGNFTISLHEGSIPTDALGAVFGPFASIDSNTAFSGGGVQVNGGIMQDGNFNMTCGVIENNTATPGVGGGVAVGSGPFGVGTFTKGINPILTPGLIVDGIPGGIIRANTAATGAQVIAPGTPPLIRDGAVGPTDALDSNVPGTTGGWD